MCIEGREGEKEERGERKGRKISKNDKEKKIRFKKRGKLAILNIYLICG